MTKRLAATQRGAHRSAPPAQAHAHELDAHLPIWNEALFGAELLLLHASPVYYGLGVPHGDGSAVVVIPGFLGTDVYVTHLNSWLRRIGYRAHFSGIGINADCPNLLIQYRVNQTIDLARAESGRKVHLIGHSLGGLIARSVAAQRPNDIASVTSLAAPFSRTIVHRSVFRAAKEVRRNILNEHGTRVSANCYTRHCTCDFVNNLRSQLPKSIIQTSIYTRHDGIVDWRYCRSGDPDIDFEVSGTHIGLVFNPSVYSIIAERLAWIDSQQE